MENNRKRKTREGVVISTKMDKTVAVRVDRKVAHSRYSKVIIRSKKYYAHTEQEGLKEGQKVRIEETRPLSKLKRWRVIEVL